MRLCTCIYIHICRYLCMLSNFKFPWILFALLLQHHFIKFCPAVFYCALPGLAILKMPPYRTILKKKSLLAIRNTGLIILKEVALNRFLHPSIPTSVCYKGDLAERRLSHLEAINRYKVILIQSEIRWGSSVNSKCIIQLNHFLVIIFRKNIFACSKLHWMKKLEGKNIAEKEEENDAKIYFVVQVQRKFDNQEIDCHKQIKFLSLSPSYRSRLSKEVFILFCFLQIQLPSRA